MKPFKGNALSWELSESIIELTLHHPPSNEIGRVMLAEIEQFVTALESVSSEASVLIIYSQLKSGFSAGGDLHGCTPFCGKPVRLSEQASAIISSAATAA
jgi:enoyl-CoA hydratase/carnithine racemase